MSLTAAPLAVYELDNSGADSNGFGPTASITSGSFSTTNPKLGTHSLNGTVNAGAGVVGNLSSVPNGSHAITCWAKIPTASANCQVTIKNGAKFTGLVVDADIDTNLYLTNGTGSVGVDTGNVPSANWRHYAVTWDGAASKFYVDGILKHTDSTNLASANASAAAFICSSLGGGRYQDQVAIFDYALTADDIAYIYNAGAGRAYASWEVTGGGGGSNDNTIFTQKHQLFTR